MADGPLQDSIRLQTKPSGSQTDDASLIEYYRAFLNNLRDILQHDDPKKQDISFVIAGYSLAGFPVSHPNSTTSSKLHSKSVPYSLEGQIEDVNERLNTTIADIMEPRRSEKPLQVILVGHSVGTYILMSLLQRRVKHRQAFSNTGETTFGNIIGGICLFPTVVDLHKSPNGRKASWIARVPYFSLLIQYLTKALCTLTAFATLVKLVERITGQPSAAARITAAFLASPTGVRQAIYLAQHELLEMREDSWSDDVWRTTAPSTEQYSGSEKLNIDQTKLFFYWGENDDWIDNSTRDAVIAARGDNTDDTKPYMEIDSFGTPHDFCIRPKHCALVAEKVAGYVHAALALTTARENDRE